MLPKKISVIVTTYNRPDALALVLWGLATQTQKKFEVIVADDGSTQITAELVENLRAQLPYALQHSWQEDKGFRAAMARNQAILKASGDYFIFLDGDSVPFSDFIARHCQLAELNCFVAGNRILLNQRFTAQVIRQKLPLWTWQARRWFFAYLRRDINRLLPLFRLSDHFFRKYNQGWQGAKTCNLAVWRGDIFKINGFDEQFQGWGHEDAELVVRLLRSGVQRKEGRFAVPVLHLWHSEHERNQELANRQRLEKMLMSKNIVAQRGLAIIPNNYTERI